MKTKRAIRVSEELNKKLLDHEFNCTDVFTERYSNAKIVARHYCQAENAVAVLSNMPLDTSYICYGHLGEKLNLGNGVEEVASIWESSLIELIHPDDIAEKKAWELQFLTFMNTLPQEQKSDYYLQHYLRMRDARGNFLTIRHRIFYLDFDADGNVQLTLCLYTVASQNTGVTGIIHSLDDRLVSQSSFNIQGLLSMREREILAHICSGKSSKQIADHLNISNNTVNNHRQNILRKLQCQNTTEAIVVAGKLGILGAK